MLHLRYYAAFIFSNCILSISFVIVIDSYCETTWLIVSWIIQISWLIILRTPSWKKPFWFLKFQVNPTSKNVSFRSSEHHPPPSPTRKLPVLRHRAYSMTLRFRRSFVTDKKDRWANISLFRSQQINEQQNQIDIINQLSKNF